MKPTDKVTKREYILAIFTAILFFFIGYLIAPREVTKTKEKCSVPVDVSRYKLQNEAAKKCVEKGGVPRYSAWNGALIDCKGLSYD